MVKLFKIFSLTMLLLASAEPAFAGGFSVGDAMRNVANSFSNAPSLFATFAYIAGAMMVVWSIFTFRDHVDGGSGAPNLSTAVKRMLMGGCFLALPAVIEAAVETWIGNGMLVESQGISGSTGVCNGDSAGLDSMAVCFINNIATPMSIVLSAFAYIGGILLILLAISRITRSYQEGARGPTGIGTIMTLLAGGALLSSGQMMAAFSNSIFGDAMAVTNPIFTGRVGDAIGDNAEVVATTISAVMVFVSIVGWIAFIRGWFVLRAVADGSQQASMAQALTFLFGGALAVNMGDLVNAIAASVGTDIGIAFY